MKQSQLFYKSEKEIKGTEAISHNLLLRAGFIDQLTAGVYTFLPLGLIVLKKIENIVRNKMSSLSGQEVLMPCLTPKENWQKTGRWNNFDVLFKMKGNADKEYALGPTHEEVISPLAKKIVFSYKDLPLYLFQLQTKFRNELRVKAGLLRTREFLMKDLYSFHQDQKDLDIYYDKVTKAYIEIFKELGIGKRTYKTLASGGTFSKYSHEFQTITTAGEDTIFICQKCSLAINAEIKQEKCPECGASDFKQSNGVEVGNIFKLGNKYSLPFDLTYKDKNGENQSVLMGCYGIGISRLVGAIVEINNDSKGIIWPRSVAPFLVHIVQIENTLKVKKTALNLYKQLKSNNIEVLYDDRENKTAGEKFAESDLIGIPFRVIVSEKTLKQKSFEVKERGKNKAKLVKDVLKYVK